MNLARSLTAMGCGKPALVLAAIALLLRGVIAPGLMIDPTAMARGEIKLVICTPSGAKSVAVAPGKEPLPSQFAHDDICPYAAPGHAGKLVDPVVLATVPPQPAIQPWKADGAFSSTRVFVFAARAPPSIA
jgi:hypothetical protein